MRRTLRLGRTCGGFLTSLLIADVGAQHLFQRTWRFGFAGHCDSSYRACTNTQGVPTRPGSAPCSRAHLSERVTDTRNKSLRTLAAVAVSFTVLAVTIMLLAAKGVVTFQLGLLMLVGLVGLYFGFGALAIVYRFISKLA